MAILTFMATIRVRGINPYVLVSSFKVEGLKPGWRKPLPVLVRINEKPKDSWRINLMPAGNGNFYLYLHQQIRKVSNTKVGERVRVELRFDPSYRGGPIHPMPKWFRDGLSKNPLALQNWEALGPSRKKEILRYFSLLKSSEAQARNLTKAISVLSGNPGRFMARTWKNGA